MQINNHRAETQTVAWSVSCQDARFLAGESHNAFDSLGAVAAGQIAGRLSRTNSDRPAVAISVCDSHMDAYSMLTWLCVCCRS